MAGSNHSGEDMEAGRTNRAEQQTRIWAQSENGKEFNGDVILVVEAARDIEDNDFANAQVGLHGIRGSSIGGTGVIGLSSQLGDIDIALATKVGVFGGGDTGVRGQGRTGIEGIGFSGGTGHGSSGGTGIVGRGGKRSAGAFHGAGVIGLVGSRPGDEPVGDHNLISGAGVFGRGVEGERDTRPSPGVIGQGGTPLAGSSAVPGVVGLSVGLGILPDLPELDTGVYGLGETGVTGSGVTGVAGHGDEMGVFGTGTTGVKGAGTEGRGGVFTSERAAQVQLVPSPGARIVEQSAFIPTVVSDPRQSGPSLPRTGRGGDLMSLADDQGQCTFWFCVHSGNSDNPAKWTQVLLGPRFDGSA
jgi:hypothetical protein